MPKADCSALLLLSKRLARLQALIECSPQATQDKFGELVNECVEAAEALEEAYACGREASDAA
jgi:hypothetical protein